MSIADMNHIREWICLVTGICGDKVKKMTVAEYQAEQNKSCVE